LGGDLDRQGLADPLDERTHARGRGLGQHLQPLRPHLPLRGLQGVRVRPRGRAPRPPPLRGAELTLPARVEVRKTYKMYVGGEFVRSESGRSFMVGEEVNVPRGSCEDLRDAVKAARGAFGGWSRRTAMNR